jgi:hypothetical protein
MFQRHVVSDSKPQRAFTAISRNAHQVVGKQKNASLLMIGLPVFNDRHELLGDPVIFYSAIVLRRSTHAQSWYQASITYLPKLKLRIEPDRMRGCFARPTNV